MSEKGKQPEEERSPWEPPEGSQGLPDIETDGDEPAQAGRVVPIKDFKGDPRRVIGHPSNPTTPMTEAFARNPEFDPGSPPASPAYDSPTPEAGIPQPSHPEHPNDGGRETTPPPTLPELYPPVNSPDDP